MSLPLSYRSRRGHIHLPRVPPEVGCWYKTPTPAAPQQQQNQNEPRRVRLRAKDLLRDFEQDGHEVYNSPQTSLGASLATLGQLEDTPAIRYLQAHIRVPTAQVEERGPGYTRSAASSSPGIGRSDLTSDVTALPPPSARG
jgi:hypothetical protein